MFKLLPTLLSLAILLVLTSACNRDAVDSSQSSSGTFLAPASAPLDPNARAIAEEAKPRMAPEIPEEDDYPGKKDAVAQQITEEEMAAAKRAAGGRIQARSRPVASSTSAAPEAPKTMDVPTTGSKPALDYDRPVVTISKAACYGKCRQFALTLTNDRRLILDAGKNMDRKGKYSRALNASEYNELLVAMQAANPAGLKEVYPTVAKNIPADVPATVLRYPDLDGNERKVEVYYDAPEKLDAFLTSFEAWVDKDGWIRMAE